MIADSELRQKILEGLEAHVEMHANSIEVEVNDGFVSLSGIAQNAEDKASIEGYVESVDGVKDVMSSIELDAASDLARSLSGQDDFLIYGP